MTDHYFLLVSKYLMYGHKIPLVLKQYSQIYPKPLFLHCTDWFQPLEFNHFWGSNIAMLCLTSSMSVIVRNMCPCVRKRVKKIKTKKCKKFRAGFEPRTLQISESLSPSLHHSATRGAGAECHFLFLYHHVVIYINIMIVMGHSVLLLL